MTCVSHEWSSGRGCHCSHQHINLSSASVRRKPFSIRVYNSVETGKGRSKGTSGRKHPIFVSSFPPARAAFPCTFHLKRSPLTTCANIHYERLGTGLQTFCWTGVFFFIYYSAVFVILVPNVPQFRVVYLWPFFFSFFCACDWSSTVAVSRADAAGGSPVKQAPRRNGRERPNEVFATAAAIVPPPVNGSGRERVPPRVLSVLCCPPIFSARAPQKPSRHQVDEPVLPGHPQSTKGRFQSFLASLHCRHFFQISSTHFFPHFCHSAPMSDVPEGNQQLFVPLFFLFCHLCLLSVPSLCFLLSSLIYEPLHSSGLSAY